MPNTARAKASSAEPISELDAAIFVHIFNGQHFGFAVFDHAFRFVRVNPLLAEINGIAPEAHLGKRPDELLPELPMAEIYEAWRKVIGEGRPWLGYRFAGKTRAGPGVWEEDFYPLQVQGATGILAVIRDVSAEVTKDRTLHELETVNAFARQAAEAETKEALGDAVVAHAQKLSGAKGGLLAIRDADDPAIVRVVAYRGFGDEHMAAWDAFPISDEVLINRAMHEKRALSFSRSDATVHFKLAGDFDAMVVFPLMSGEHAVGAVAAVFGAEDVEGVRDSTAMNALAEICASAVLRIRFNARLLQEIDIREDFLAFASHEVKTPLTAATLQAQLLLAKAKKMPELAEPGEGLLASLEKIDNYLKKLLSATVIRTGQLELEREPVDLLVLVEECVRLVEPLRAKSGSTIAVSGAPVRGRWDRHRLDEVFTNLLANALKYGQGKPIAVTVSETAQAADVEITDAGVGIPEDRIPGIFQLYDRAARKDRQGLGIGLYLVDRLVRAHGGHVSVQSKHGRGSTFSVWLPKQ